MMFYANIQVMYNPSYSQLKDLHVYAGYTGNREHQADTQIIS